jgi:hypothetical protein
MLLSTAQYKLGVMRTNTCVRAQDRLRLELASFSFRHIIEQSVTLPQKQPSKRTGIFL